MTTHAWNPDDEQIFVTCTNCGGPGVTTPAEIARVGADNIAHVDPDVCSAVRRNLAAEKKKNKQH